MSILCSEYEIPIYSSLHLGKMHVFGPCIFLSNRHEKAGFLYLFSAYMVGNFANENKERVTYIIQRSGKFPLSECNSI